MSSITVAVNFKLGESAIPKKTFHTDSTNNIRWLKDQIFFDLGKSGIKISADKEINFGIARVDSLGQIINFVSDHLACQILSTTQMNSEPNTVLFTYKSRTEYPNISSKQIIAFNTTKTQQRFIELMGKEDVHQIQRFLEGGLDPNFVLLKTGDIPIFKWIGTKKSQKEIILDLLVENGAHLDFRNSKGRCALHEAISNENLNAINLLFCRGANLEEWDSEGVPALFYAINRDIHVRVLEFLLDLCVDLSLTDSSKNNILHFCIKMGLVNHFAEIVKFISEHLSSEQSETIMSGLNKSGNAPIHSCVIQNQRACLEILLGIPYNLSIKNSTGETASQLALRTCNAPIITMIGNAKNLESGKQFSRFDPTRFSQSLTICKKFATTLSRRESKGQTCKLVYPAFFVVTDSFPSTSNEELPLFAGETILVYLVLKSKVCFGYKNVHNRSIYGWFPASCIGIKNESKIKEFQASVGDYKSLVEHIPNISQTTSSPFMPKLLFVNIPSGTGVLGIEVGRKFSSGTESVSDSIAFNISKFYIRRIFPDGICDDGSLQVGDQVLYILQTDITGFRINELKRYMKKIISKKMAPLLSDSDSRQLSFLIVRATDVSVEDRRTLSSKQYIISNESNNEQKSEINDETLRNDNLLTDVSRNVFPQNQDKNVNIISTSSYDQPLPVLPPDESLDNSTQIPSLNMMEALKNELAKESFRARNKD